MAKNPLANAGDTGPIPAPGRCAMEQLACVPQLLSSRAGTTEAHVPTASAPQKETPLRWEARTLQWRVAPHLQQLEKACAQ